MRNSTDGSDFLKIIQITDTHFFADDNSELFGMSCNQRFKEFISHLSQEELEDTDLILLTGDVSQDETPESYEKIARHIDSLKIPAYWIPGNHDELHTIKTSFDKASNLFHSRRLTTQHWDFIFLNTKLAGTPDGFLSADELEALKAEVAKSTTKPTTIVMHHHPFAVNTPLVDKSILRNANEFWDIVSNTNVKLIICGHVHNDYSMEHNGVRIETAPATCFQFTKKSVELAVEKKTGCKIYQFYADKVSATGRMW